MSWLVSSSTSRSSYGGNSYSLASTSTSTSRSSYPTGGGSYSTIGVDAEYYTTVGSRAAISPSMRIAAFICVLLALTVALLIVTLLVVLVFRQFRALTHP